MLTLIERDFTVNLPLAKAWQHLARVDQWPTWAHHIKHIEINPGGELGIHSSGLNVLANGIKSTFRMTEFNPGQNWKWVGPFLWMTIHYDHPFEVLSSTQTRLKFVIEASGFGVFGRVFAGSIGETWRGQFHFW
jgi:hypothetical protein